MADAQRDVAGVVAPPPLIYAVPLAAGLLLGHIVALPIVQPRLAMPIGLAFVLLGGVLVPAVRAFRRAGTAPQPWRPSTALVVSGPYRFSRNPMYLGFTLLYAGIAIWANTTWPFLLLPLVLVTMVRGVIEREEAYLERRFGAAYLDYKARVRRWL